MHGISTTLKESGAQTRDGFETWIFRLCAYALPLLLLVTSVVALWWWPSGDSDHPAHAVTLRVLPDEADRFSPFAAAQGLEASPATLTQRTNRATHPFWLRIDLAALPAGTRWLDFPSRHAWSLTCWAQQGQGGRHIGAADRGSATGAVTPSRAGFVLNLATLGGTEHLICRATFQGPARIAVTALDDEALQAADKRFQRDAGALDGGLIMLAVFLFVTALINRNSAYGLFSVWMLLNLRMAALSAGWDVQWLGHQIPAHLLLPMRAVTMSLYIATTYALFRRFFQAELAQMRAGWPLTLIGWSCLPLLALSLLLPYGQFLPLAWSASAYSVLVSLVYLARIVAKTRSPVAYWYGGAMAITLFAGMVEVMAAAVGVMALADLVNSVTAALSSSLLAALAVAAQMKSERDDRLAAQRRLIATYKVMPVGLFSASADGRFSQANPALEQLLGGPVLNGPRADWSLHFPAESWRQLQLQLHTKGAAELDVVGHNEHRYHVRATLIGRTVEGVLQDITDTWRATERLRLQAEHDPLTGVLNRFGLEQRLRQLQASLMPDQCLSMAYLDLDRFKLINDLYGHAAGDVVLRQVCDRITQSLSGEMRLGRVGGDEFVILLPGLSLELAAVISRGVLTSICNAPYLLGDRAFQVRGSLGLVEIDASTAFKDAMASADRACREAKRAQGDGLVVYEHDGRSLQELAAEMQLMERLAAGGEVQGLFLEMQPIMSLRKPAEVLNFEVLLRMRDEQGRRVPTPRLIAAGEQAGRMSLIDRWVLRNTLTWLRAHKEQLGSTQFACINLSGASLNDERFIDDAFDMLDAFRDVAPMICLEVTESVALHDLANTQRFIHELRQYGTKVALDDFGAGYTSFSYLKDLPSDLLKIDGSFIVNMNQHPANVAIVEAIVNLARNLGMKTIAEWAEDAATVETLAEIGVDYVQGFAVSAALDPKLLVRERSCAALVRDADTRILVERLQRDGALPDLFVGGKAA